MSLFPGILASSQYIVTTPASGYLAVTDAYLNSDATLSSLTTTKKDAIDRWFRDLNGESNPSYTTYNVWSRIVTLYPFIGGTSTSLGKNAANPGTYDLSHVGSPTFNANSITYDGTSQYSDTNFTPNGEFTTFANSNFTGFAFHRTDTNVDSVTNGTVGETGGGNSYAQCLGGVSGPGFVVLILSAKTAVQQSLAYGTPNFYAAAWSATSTLNAYVNNTRVKQTALTWDNTPSRSSYIGAIHTATVGYGGPCTFDFYMSIISTWTDAEIAFVYTATKALKSALGVTWN